ncbi:Uncharacterized membrane protein YczE [Lachnospiraceae bacterium KH1T2]|nr:Uncharacterized membrane protein YczE [Lachnospiraceae bacterium KH1T2]
MKEQNKIDLSVRRIIGMVLGVVIIGLGCAIFKHSALGNDPITAFNLRTAEILGINFGVWQLVPNLIFLVFEFIWGRKYIGIGTIVNGGFIGFVISFFSDMLYNVLGSPETIVHQVIFVMIGVIVTSLGVSFYQTANLGIGPYDSISLMMHDHLKFPYFGCRLFTDALAAAFTFFMGGLIGLGTLVSAFGFGPFIAFFNKRISEKWIY